MHNPYSKRESHLFKTSYGDLANVGVHVASHSFPGLLMIRCIVLALSLSSMSLPALSAQEARSASGDPRAAMTAEAQKSMAPFAWLIGEWEGTATVFMANGGTFALVQRETVTSAAFATALFIQGRGRAAVGGSDRLLWDAAGLFGYDVPSKKFSFTSASGSGQTQMFAVTTHGDGFTWGFTDAKSVENKYVITRTSDGKWKEVGQTSPDGGKTWVTTIELLLSKVK